MEIIVNKVAESGLITLDLAPYLPDEARLATFDLKPFLFREMILREKDYRAALQQYEWSQLTGKYINITCTADAIIPVWAYMLAAQYLIPIAQTVYFGTKTELINHLIIGAINNIDTAEFADQRVVIKGCGDIHIPEAAYVAITTRLQPVVKSLMYGEPCSTVPIYKKR